MACLHLHKYTVTKSIHKHSRALTFPNCVAAENMEMLFNWNTLCTIATSSANISGTTHWCSVCMPSVANAVTSLSFVTPGGYLLDDDGGWRVVELVSSTKRREGHSIYRKKCILMMICKRDCLHYCTSALRLAKKVFHVSPRFLMLLLAWEILRDFLIVIPLYLIFAYRVAVFSRCLHFYYFLIYSSDQKGLRSS